MTVTLVGKVIEEIPVQPLKALSLIEVNRLRLRSIAVIPVQPEKAFFPMVVMLFGRTRLVMPEQLS